MEGDTLSDKEFPFFSQIYVNDEGVDFLTKLSRPFIDFSHISLMPRFQPITVQIIIFGKKISKLQDQQGKEEQ